ncbi:hypothetical protein [Aliarcobacter butzleri]|uniref:hypothetical protein n=1 Tax=Aliarcobacter butzleri TaxID=28197 RepID=UPI0012699236|nr:hypothetical protein [Aliarcobacter butzleri]
MNKETLEKLNFIDKIDIKNIITPDFESAICNSELIEKYPFNIDYNNFKKHYPLEFFIELLKEDLTSLSYRQKEEHKISKNIKSKLNLHSQIDFRKRFKRVRFWIAYELAIWLHNFVEDEIFKVFSTKEIKEEAIRKYGKDKFNKVEVAFNKLLKIKTLQMSPEKATNLKYNILSFISLVYEKDFLYEETIIID